LRIARFHLQIALGVDACDDDLRLLGLDWTSVCLRFRCAYWCPVHREARCGSVALHGLVGEGACGTDGQNRHDDGNQPDESRPSLDLSGRAHYARISLVVGQRLRYGLKGVRTVDRFVTTAKELVELRVVDKFLIRFYTHHSLSPVMRLWSF
jgi:hypothetical protein